MASAQALGQAAQALLDAMGIIPPLAALAAITGPLGRRVT